MIFLNRLLFRPSNKNIIQSWTENNGIRLTTRNFRTELVIKIFELKGWWLSFTNFENQNGFCFRKDLSSISRVWDFGS